MRKVESCFIFDRPYNAHLDLAHASYCYGRLGLDEDATYEEVVKTLVERHLLWPLPDSRLRYKLVLEVIEEHTTIEGLTTDEENWITRLIYGDRKKPPVSKVPQKPRRANTTRRSISNAVTLREGQTLASTGLTHLITKEWGASSSLDPRNILYCAISIEIEDSAPSKEEPSSTPSWDKIINAFLTSLAANTINFTASIVTITMALTAIEKSWSKKPSTDNASSQVRSPQPPESEIVAVRLLMTDGTQHRFEEWLTDLDRLKHYIDAFNQPSSSLKPLQAIFVLKKDGPIVVDVSEGTQNNLPLNEVLSYLHIDSAQQ